MMVNWIGLTPLGAILLYAGLLVIGLTYVKARGQEHDAGGYNDSFATFTEAPWDKAIHCGASFALVMGAVLVLGVPLGYAVGITIAVGVAWEILFGWVSWRDIVADALGVALAAGLLAVAM